MLAAVAVQWWQRQCSGSMLAAVWQRQAMWWQCWQRGGSGGGGGGSTPAAAGLAAAAAVCQHHGVSGGRKATRAVLLPRVATVATKTLAATAIAGAQTAINNKLKAAEATATKMAMAMLIKM